MVKKKTLVATVEGVVREPGHLYFITKQGDVGKIQRNTGHVLGREHRPKTVRKLGIKKQKGFMYYIKPDGDRLHVYEQRMRNG